LKIKKLIKDSAFIHSDPGYKKQKNREKIKQKYEEATLNIDKKLLSKPIENKNSIIRDSINYL
jgi:hypothetical protein